MRTRDYYRTEVVTAPPHATAAELAERMGEYAVGCVVIVDEDRHPLGVVTDRDLLCRVIARSGDGDKVQATSIMSQPPVTAETNEPVESVIERMRAAAVRRIVVVRDGRVHGLVSVDDLIVELGRELDDLGEAARRSVEVSRQRGRHERRRGEIEETLVELRASVERAGRDVADFLSREFESLRDRVRRSGSSSNDDEPKR